MSTDTTVSDTHAHRLSVVTVGQATSLFFVISFLFCIALGLVSTRADLHNAWFALLPGVTLIRGGGHFPGGAMLHCAQGANGRGALLSADIATVTPDRKFLSFMRSYPNLIPLSAREVEAIAAALAPFAFEAIYGHFFDRVIAADARQVLARSVARYLAAIAGTARGPME